MAITKLKTQVQCDVLVLGGGAAGLMAALTAGQRGKHVVVLEVSNKFGKKILMSGGGRCNFTNLDVEAEHFICKNPHFVKSALAQYTQWDFISLVSKHGIDYHEKDHGQLFCDKTSKDILKMLLDECHAAEVDLRLECEVSSVTTSLSIQAANSEGPISQGGQSGFCVASNKGYFTATSLIVATGGLSIPSLGGATGLGYRLAEQFGLSLLEREASLVPMTLSGKWQFLSSALSGVSLPVVVSVGKIGFKENMLFTHRGLSGPAILQLSNYWNVGEEIDIDVLPNCVVSELLIEKKHSTPNLTIASVLNKYLPKSLVLELQARWWQELSGHALAEITNQQLRALGKRLNQWRIKPSGTESYRTAEVTRGGIDVASISSKTMAVNDHPNLFFIGEVLDVTGHLGGYNFQWAWSSGYVAGSNA